mgnify:FL=1
MKIYTRTGDDGKTALFGGGRVPKDSLRVAAYGPVDELNAVIGWGVTLVADETTRSRLEGVQHDLFAIGSALATPPPAEGRKSPVIPDVPVDRIADMEGWIDEADEELEPLRAFILPGGSPGAAALHVARTVCRRAERAVVALAHEEDVADGVTIYLNRLSDLLFTLARLENLRAGRGDVEWVKPTSTESTA